MESLGVSRRTGEAGAAFHANIVAMEKGLLGVEDVADDYVHCTQCGAYELRCPNTLRAGDFSACGRARSTWSRRYVH